MSCRPVTLGLEVALRGTSAVDREKRQTSTVAADSDSKLDPAKESVIVVSPQDMPLIFGPTLWRKGFLPVFPSDASRMSPAPVESSSPTFSTTRSFSTRIRRIVRYGAVEVLHCTSLPLFRRVTVPVSVYGMQPCPIGLGGAPRWFRSSLRCTSFPRSSILRSAVDVGSAGIRAFIGRSLFPVSGGR